jgi:hypothetical protein
MGLLDDAIREHLELKRRHGADPSEVERQEQEALGPARRGAAPPAEDAEPDAGAVSVGMLDEDEAPDAPSEPYDDSADEPEPSVPAGEPEAPVAPPAPPPDEREREPEAEADAEAAADVEPIDEPVPPDAAGEDVLEETPDFLQETPEHDRLWFEQKPPRDFEF